jgi:ribonuclease P protein component
MTEKGFTLAKEERLSWKRHIDSLFEKGESFVAFPLRVIYLPVEQLPVEASVLISVSKKKFKRAVKRNKVKRQIREAYRLQKMELHTHLVEKERKILIAFLYVDKEIHPHTMIEKAMRKSISMLKEKIE